MNCSVKFTPEAWEDYLYWQSIDKKTLKKIHELLKDIGRDAYSGIGKPEPLKHALSGWSSRRITDEHRMVYRVESNTVVVLQLRYHYD